jgi:phage tail protein X
VLLTDGNENLERAADEVAQLAADGIDVLVSPIAPGGRRDVLVDRVVVPERVRAQEKFEVRVVLASTYDGQGTLKLYRDDVYLGQSSVAFKKGERTVHAFRDSVAQRGIHHYRAVLEPVGQDGPRANDFGEAFTVTEGRPAVLYLHGGAQPSGPFLAALKESRFTVEVRRPEGMPGRLADLAACQADGAYVRAVVGRERNPATDDAPPPPPAESDDGKVRRALQGDPSAVVRRDARRGFIEVRVRKGDTLSSLAKTHLGESAQWRAILDANPDLSRPEDVREGQLLRIPTR